MAFSELLTWAEAATRLDAAFARAGLEIEIRELFLKSALHEMESTALTVAPVGGQAVVPAAQGVTITSTGTAAEAFSTYVSSGGAVNASGAATSMINVNASTPVVVEKLGEVGTPGFAGPLGVLSADVGVVGAAIAPLLGVALGVGLYELNPELWTKISQTVLPFAYPDSNKVPIYVDSDGNTYVDGELVEELKDLFTDEGIGGDGTVSHTYNGTTLISSNTASMQEHGGFAAIEYIGGDLVPMANQYDNNVTIYILGREPFTYYTTDGITITPHQVTSMSTTHNGTPFYYETPITWGGGSQYWDVVNPYATDSKVDVATIIYDGVSTPSGNYPEGTYRWGTGQPLDYTQNKRSVYTDPDLTTTKDVYPVALPPNGSVESIPDTESATEPEDQDTQVKPYDLPDAVPFPTYNPDYNPQSDPQTNPSAPPTSKDPPQIRDGIPPIDIGTSPSDPIPIVPLPTANVNGLIAVYHPTASELYSFSRWLWVTYSDASNTQLIWNNPFDGVIGCHELYCTPTDIGRRTIKCGFLDSGIDSAIISRYTEINCGNIVIPEYYGNYLDYSPYTKVHVYLPFIGIMQLNADDIIGHAVNITYRIDEYNGSCIAMIRSAKTTQHQNEEYDLDALLYQFEGNCAVEVPLSGGSQANIRIAAMTGIMQLATSVVGGAYGGLMSGNAGMAVGGAVMGLGSGLASAASNLLHAKSSVQKSGQFGASYGAMGEKKPFFIINRPVQVQVMNYNLEYGFPAHKFVTIGACTGFLRCREVNVISARATNEEKNKIEELLKTGVFVQ